MNFISVSDTWQYFKNTLAYPSIISIFSSACPIVTHCFTMNVKLNWNSKQPQQISSMYVSQICWTYKLYTAEVNL